MFHKSSESLSIISLSRYNIRDIEIMFHSEIFHKQHKDDNEAATLKSHGFIINGVG